MRGNIKKKGLGLLGGKKKDGRIIKVYKKSSCKNSPRGLKLEVI